MKDKLYEILGKCSEIDYELECMIELLEMLFNVCDGGIDLDAGVILQVLKGNLKNLKTDAAAVVEEMDILMLDKKIT